MTSSASPRTAVLVVVLVVLVVPIVTACSGEVVIAASEATQLLAAAAERAKTWQPTERERVTLRAEVPTAVRQGALVPIRVTLHNGTGRPVAIGFGKTQGFDVVVTRAGAPADSGPVWSPMKMEELGSDVTITDPLGADRDTTFTATWPGTDDFGHIVPRGRYQLRATVTAGLLETRKMWTPWMPIEVR